MGGLQKEQINPISVKFLQRKYVSTYVKQKNFVNTEHISVLYMTPDTAVNKVIALNVEAQGEVITTHTLIWQCNMSEHYPSSRPSRFLHVMQQYSLSLISAMNSEHSNAN